VLVVTGFYPALIWWTFILVGLAVGRSDLQSGRVRARLLAAGAGLAVLGYGLGWVTTQWWADGRLSEGPYDGDVHPGGYELAWLSGASPHSGTTFEIVGSVGVALMVIAVCLVLAERLPRVTFPLAAVGSMALTVYTAQVVAIWLIGADEYVDNGLWLAFVLVSLVLATAWRLVLGRGPLERVLTWSSTLAARPAHRRPSPGTPTDVSVRSPRGQFLPRASTDHLTTTTSTWTSDPAGVGVRPLGPHVAEWVGTPAALGNSGATWHGLAGDQQSRGGAAPG
jgi:hypothetical protein